MAVECDLDAWSDAAPNGRFRVELFGALKIFDPAGRPVHITSRKTLALFGILASRPGEWMSRGKIASLLWDLVPDRQARKSLRQALINLATALASEPSAIDATRDALRLRADAVSTDLEDLLRGALAEPARYSAPFLDGLEGVTESLDEWLFHERSSKTEIVRMWHEDHISALVAHAAPAAARVNAARQLLAFDPAHERAWRVLISGLVDLGDRGQALREYRACENTLRRLLDAEPSGETKTLLREITRRAPDGPARPGAAVSDGGEHDPIGASSRQASIAVLPLIKLSKDSQILFLSNGLLEGIIHILSGIGDLFVISRGSVTKYDSRQADPREVGVELGVHYILTGTISGLGRKVAIYFELAETTTGKVLWTDRVRIQASDLFDLQESIASEVVAAIAPSVRANELARARRKPPSNLTAYDLLLQALDKLYTLDRPAFEEAGDYFLRSMGLDPGFAAVRSHAATWHNFRVAQGWSDDAARDSAKAADLSSAALMLDHNDATALSIQGQVLSFTRRDYERARTFLDRALRVGPSCHLAWTLSSATHGWTGDSARAVEHAERALRLSPFDPFAFFSEHMLSQGHYVGGDFEQAIFWGRRAADRNDRLTSNLRTLSAALVAAGEIEEARRIARRLRAIEPNFDLDRFRARTPFRPEIRDAHVERLRVAGLA